ncbi:2898_t:CDS:1, partial [Entrophospora sp. SA101]
PNLETFLRSKVSDTSVLSEPFPIYHTSRLCTTDLPMMPSKYLDQHIQQLAYLNCLRHSISNNISAGILTCCPSTTLFSLALGPD